MREQGTGNREEGTGRWACLAVFLLLLPFLCFAMTSADALKVILNSKNAVGVKTLAAAK